MPEGPEIKVVAKTLAKELRGRKLGSLWHSHHKLRRAVNYSLFNDIKGTPIDDVSSYGKMLFIHIDKKPALFAQLGMTGQLFVTKSEQKIAPHTHMRWQLIDSVKELRYVDPRRFGLLGTCNEESKQALISQLGPDPFLMSPSDYEPLITKMKRSQRAIKDVLLDQSIIAGVGNIYASEALFLAKINPTKRSSHISKEKYHKLLASITYTLNLALKNSGTTFSSYVDGTGKGGDNLAYLQVFQKTGHPCPTCKNPIQRIKQAGRSTFLCPVCQN